MTSLINKARKPKFELHLKIFDLNNVPLVSGVSLIKWHLPHSIHGEHRGRTPRCPIANHRVEYNYAKVVPVRIAIDKNSSLTECPIEFEVLQEFSLAGAGGATGGRDEKISLGIVRLNLSEYIEESEGILRDLPGGGRLVAANAAAAAAAAAATALAAAGPRPTSSGTSDRNAHARKRSSLSSGSGLLAAPDISPRSSRTANLDDNSASAAVDLGEEGMVVRRYLMQDSKINSTLKIGILMIQVDGDRNFVAPALKTAPTFGGITGIVAGGEPLDPGGNGVSGGIAGDSLVGAGGAARFGSVGGTAADPSVAPSLFSKSRDASEIQDMYRRALAASWVCRPGELPADECVEDIFAGGDGYGTGHGGRGSDLHSYSSGSRSHKPSSSDPRSSANSFVNDDGPGGTGSARPVAGLNREDSSPSTDEDPHGRTTLRPRDYARFLRSHSPRRHKGHHRSHSGASHRSTSAHTARDHTPSDSSPSHHHHYQHRRTYSSHGRDASPSRNVDSDRERSSMAFGSPNESIESLATTLGSSERGRDEGFKHTKEVDELEARGDLVAWTTRKDAAVS